MSDRRHLGDVKSSVVQGDVVSAFRDNDTSSYRLFVNKGWRDSGGGGHQIDSCECCDLSIEDLLELSEMVQEVVAKHEPWQEPDPHDGQLLA